MGKGETGRIMAERVLEKKYKFKVSIVMAVYNVEKYLEEALESVICQDIGFEKNVQIILVDDGTPDRSGEICDAYQKKYPSNIKVIHKTNGGVSSARNEGLKYIEGRYVNFMDPDDKLSPGTLKAVYSFFTKSEKDVDLISIPMTFFEGREGPHILNYKFNSGKNDILDLWKRFNCVQMSLSSAFITKETAEKIYFDTELKYAEDAKVIMQILLKKCRYGVVPSANYWYRIRITEDSAISSSRKVKEWYISYLEKFSLETLKMYRDEYGFIPYFVQYTIMYDLQWRFKQAEIPQGVLTEEEEKYFRSLLIKCLSYIDNRMILSQKYMTKEYMDYVLSLKSENAGQRKVEYFGGDMNIRYGNFPVISLSNFTLSLEILTCGEKSFCIEGSVKTLAEMQNTEIQIYAEVKAANKKKQVIACRVFDHPGGKVISLGKLLADRKGFAAEIPFSFVEGITSVKFYMKADGFPVYFNNYGTGNFFPLDAYYNNTYCCRGGYIFRLNKDTFFVEKSDFIKHIKKERRLIREIKRTSLFNRQATGIKQNPTEEEVKEREKIISQRLRTWVYDYCIKRREIWLVSDRINQADDNGEAFFEYLSSLKGKKPDVYFVISGGSSDYERLKKVGKVIDRDSEAYYNLFLKADVIISAHAEAYITNPFDSQHTRPLKDLIRNKPFIFLQHGVIKDDLSGWLQKYNKNISMFVTTTKPEYQSVLEGNYFYSDREVVMTGLPRYDRLENNPQKIITIMPTWRSGLVSVIDAKTGGRTLLPGLKESSFYQMYQSVFSDEDFLSKIQKAGYQIQLLMHPNMQVTLAEFSVSDSIRVLEPGISYREIFSESDMIITDYSSVAFDFAYLRKPVIYYQPDREEFFSGTHTYVQGYFDYDRDGFGEVCTDSEKLKECVNLYLETGCVLKEVYRERIDHTFPYSDRKNCERVYGEIQKLKSRVIYK